MAHQCWYKKKDSDFEIHERRSHDQKDDHYFDPFSLYGDDITEQFRQDVCVRAFIKGALSQHHSQNSPPTGSFAFSTYQASFQTSAPETNTALIPNEIADFKKSTSRLSRIKSSIKRNTKRMASNRIRRWRQNTAADDIGLPT